jgi:hypothetical protein
MYVYVLIKEVKRDTVQMISKWDNILITGESG